MLVSAATVWEIEIQRAAGRLEAPDGHPTLGFPVGALRLEEVRPDGGRTMSGDAWWRGWRAGSCAWGSVDLSNLEP